MQMKWKQMKQRKKKKTDVDMKIENRKKMKGEK